MTSPRRADFAGRPLYARMLFLRHLAPSGLLCFVFLEGAVVLGILLALAELVSWWGVLVLPFTVALMVKFNDLVAGASAVPPVAGETASARSSVLRPAAMTAQTPAAGPAATGAIGPAVAGATGPTVTGAIGPTAIGPVGTSSTAADSTVAGPSVAGPSAAGFSGAVPSVVGPLGAGPPPSSVPDPVAPVGARPSAAPMTRADTATGRRGNTYSFSTPTEPGLPGSDASPMPTGAAGEPGRIGPPDRAVADRPAGFGIESPADSIHPRHGGGFEMPPRSFSSGAGLTDSSYRQTEEFPRPAGFAPIVSPDPSALGYGPAVPPKFLVDGHQSDALTEVPTLGYPGAAPSTVPSYPHIPTSADPGHPGVSTSAEPGHPGVPVASVPGYSSALIATGSGSGHSEATTTPRVGHPYVAVGAQTYAPDNGHPYSTADGHPYAAATSDPGHIYEASGLSCYSMPDEPAHPAGPSYAAPSGHTSAPASGQPYAAAGGHTSVPASGQPYAAAGGQPYAAAGGNSYATVGRYSYEGQGQSGEVTTDGQFPVRPYDNSAAGSEELRPALSNALTRRPWAEPLDVRQQTARQAVSRRYE